RQSNYTCLRKLQTTKYTKRRVESCVLKSGPFIVPANSSRLDRVGDANWLAIGDAAMAFDPLSGQGVYKALQSALRAAKSLHQFCAGDTSELREYAVAASEELD